MSPADFIRVTYAEPHAGRGRDILAAHPELRALAGPQPASAWWIALLVSAQLGLAIALARQPWYVWLPAAYIAGATIDHALWVLIHECAHNLVFPARLANRVAALAANLPLLYPAAMSFCKYHLLHHRHMGELELDADLAGPEEARIVGESSAAKAVWLAAFALVIGTLRPLRLTRVPFLDRWTITNVAVQAAAVTAFIAIAGWDPFKYLFASTVLAVGLHPFGARWIQEHYVFTPGQETYSYYGPLNRVSFNVGYHNEHHDRSGEEISVDIALNFVTIDGTPHVVVAMRDMRAYRNALQKLDLLSVAVDAAASGVVITDQDGVIASVPAGTTAVQATFSAGVAEWTRGETTAELLARTDFALYRAKGAGRNRVVSG